MAATLRGNTIGFIGLGRMGFEMARNLFAKQRPGSAFVVCDVNSRTAELFAQRFRSEHPQLTIGVASSPADVVRAAQTVITVLPSTPQVEQVYTQIGGVVEALRGLHDGAGRTLCIDSTTLDVEYARQAASIVTEAGADMLDAPVSGGVTGAAAGTLSFMVGGPAHVLKRAEPVLKCMGSRIIHCGESGNGLAAKLANNLVLGVQQIAVAEAMLLGESLGLDPAVLASVINSSTGACWASSVNNPVPAAIPDKTPPSSRAFEGGFATQLMLKDMKLATQAAEDADSPMPLGETTKFLYGEMLRYQSGKFASKDFSAVYQFLRELNAEADVAEPREEERE